MKSNIFWWGCFFFFFFLPITSAEVLFLKGVHLPGKGTLLFDLTLEDGRISRIFPHPTVAPIGAEVFDFSGKWLLPGLIDLNCSLFSSPGGGFSGEEFSEAQLQKNQVSLLKCGITSIRILKVSDSRIQKLKNGEKTRIGPRLFFASPTILVPQGYPMALYSDLLEKEGEAEFFFPVTEETSLESLWTRDLNCLYVIASAGTSVSETPFPKLSGALLQKIIQEASRHQVPVIAYVETWKELQDAVQAGVQEVEGGAFLEANVPDIHSPEWQETFQSMRHHRVRYCPKIYSFQGISYDPEFFQNLGPWEKQVISQGLLDSVILPYSVPIEWRSQKQIATQWRDQALQSALALKKQKILVVAGSGSGDPLSFFGVGLYEQLQLLHQSGWSQEECIELVTESAAEVLGKSTELGKIQEGFLADLLVLDENPFENLEALKTGVWVHQGHQGYWIKHLDPQWKSGLKASPISSRFIDDFEDRNLLSPQQENWDCFSDASIGGKSRITLQLKEEGAEKSLCSAGISGELAPASKENLAFAGIEINLVPEKENAIDISAFSGIEFAVRGKGNCSIKLGTRNIYDFDYYAKEVRLTEEWTTYKIPFSEFHQQGFGVPTLWSSEDFTGIILVFYNQENSAIPIVAQVDEFRFYQK